LKVLLQHPEHDKQQNTQQTEITKQFNTTRLSDGHFGSGTVSLLSNFLVSTGASQGDPLPSASSQLSDLFTRHFAFIFLPVNILCIGICRETIVNCCQ